MHLQLKDYSISTVSDFKNTVTRKNEHVEKALCSLVTTSSERRTAERESGRAPIRVVRNVFGTRSEK